MSVERLGLSDLKAVKLEDHKNVEVIGFLMWYSIGTKLISRELLQEYLSVSGVDERFMPNAIRIPDAFRRATRAIETRIVDEKGLINNYLIREVKHKKNIVQRNLVREMIDSNTGDLSYETKSAVLHLLKDEAVVHTSVHDDNETSRELVNQALHLFDLYKTTHDDNAIRSMCSNIIRSMSPILVKQTGGVYFVPIKYEKEMYSFIELVGLLDNSEAEAIEMVDSKKGLDMIRKQTIRTFTETFDKLREAFENENLEAHEITKIVDNTELAFQIMDDYKSLLHNDILDAEKSLAGAMKMLRAVKSRKKDRKSKNDGVRQIRLFD